MVHEEQTIPLEKRVLQFVRLHNLYSCGDKVLAAVSGGADSVCLLFLLNELKAELGIELVVAHLDHVLRGADSAADADYVKKLAAGLNVPCVIEQADVSKHRSEHKLSLEEAAREVRYSFFARVAAERACSKVAVGHTLDDHIETVLMHIIRGAGTRGLIGLRPETIYRTQQGLLTVTRPLLEITRKETAEYCASHNLEPRLDASNLSMSLFRNRIRHKLLPTLRSYNPQIIESLARASSIVADEVSYIDEQSADVWNEVAEENTGTVALNKERFQASHPAIQRSVLRLAVEKLLGTLKDIEMRHIEELMAALDKPAGKSLNLPFGVVFTIEYDRYLLALKGKSVSPLPALGGEIALRVPGTTRLPGWHVETDVITSITASKVGDEYTAHFDADAVGNLLTVRKRRTGDRFQPLGMDQPKLLSEFLVDAKVPRSRRDSIPLVCAGNQIIWVTGLRMDDRFKVNDNTRRIMRIRFFRDEE